MAQMDEVLTGQSHTDEHDHGHTHHSHHEEHEDHHNHHSHANEAEACSCDHDHSHHDYNHHDHSHHDHSAHDHSHHDHSHHDHSHHDHSHHDHSHHDHSHHDHDHGNEAAACSCGHDHSHSHGHSHSHSHGGGCSCEEGIETLDKKILIRVAITAGLLILNLLLKPSEPVEIVLYLAALLVVGVDVILSAIKGLFRSFSLDETLLMSIACIGAFAIGEYFDGVMVMLLFQIGEMFQSYAVGNSRKSIRSLVDLRPDSVTILSGGEERTIPAGEAKPGDIMQVRAGERVALDGQVISGTSTLDTSALTGESLARVVEIGDEVLAGCVNQSGLLTVKITAPLDKSAVSRILDLVEQAAEKKARPEQFITRFARVYTPVVFVAAILTAAIPTLVFGMDAYTWIYRSLTFLVISCPCALVISVPLTYFAGIGGASRKGILFKGASGMDVLRKTSGVVFDKTGTLTSGKFHVSSVKPQGIADNELIMLAAYAESQSDHPLAQSIIGAYGKEIDKSRLTEYKEIRGKGVSALLDGKPILAGNQKFMRENSISLPTEAVDTSTVFVALDGKYAGYIALSDTVRQDTAALITELKNKGISRLVMLTGDNLHAAKKTAGELGITEVYADCMPEDKAKHLGDIMAEEKGSTVYIGDGINDAPVLAMADIGVAMGGLGADAAIEAADVVLMSDEPSKLYEAINLADRTGKIVIQNIVFALLVKALIMGFGVVGMAPMGLAIFADVGVSLLAVLNAMRAFR